MARFFPKVIGAATSFQLWHLLPISLDSIAPINSEYEAGSIIRAAATPSSRIKRPSLNKRSIKSAQSIRRHPF
ncbi:hypothetical protein LguiA_036062 [Lonicera macranthoides]